MIMRLSNAARFFDKDQISDGYSSLPIFFGQFTSYDGSKQDGTFSRKRTLSIAPSISLPARHVILAGPDRWILGDPNLDVFQGADMRQTIKCKKCTDSYNFLTPGQAALRTTGATTAYAFTEYLKDTVNSTTNSEYDPQYKVTMAITESPSDGMFLRSSTNLLHVRSLYKEAEGFWLLTCDEISTVGGLGWQSGAANLAGGEVSVSFPTTGVYDPITDSFPATTSTTTGILMDRYKLYDLRTQTDPLNKAGDTSLIVAKSAVTPVVGQTVACPDTWRIQSVVEYQDAWSLHLRRA